MIYISSISKSYGEKVVFKDFSVNIPRGKISCLLGPSGCGKTTLLDILAGLADCDSGTVSGINDDIAYVFQEDRLLPWATVRENLEFIVHNTRILSKAPRENTGIDSFLKTVQLTEFENYFPDQLSGGMRQRVALARAFIHPATTLLMDEPFKGLDYKLKLKLFEFLKDMWERTEKTILLVTHDVDEALILSNSIHLLSDCPPIVKKQWDVTISYKNRNIKNENYLKLRSQIIANISDEGFNYN